MMKRSHLGGALASIAAALFGTVITEGCSDDEALSPMPPPARARARGAGGSAGATGASSSSAHSSSATSSSSSGAGGGGVTCLPPSAYADLFTIASPVFCAVAIYTTDEPLGFQAPSWGAHGGPLTLESGKVAGAIDLVRWAVPAGATGKLTPTVTTVDAMIPTMGAFVGAQAIDLPFFGWTALTWSGAFPMTQGEVLLVKGSIVDKRYAANGAFALAGLASDQDHGRLLLTGLSALSDAATSKNALYAADSCGTAAAPALLPGNDPTCTPPLAIAAWGDASGPVAADKDGNVFAVMASYGTKDQAARGFAASTIARAAGATTGVDMFTLGGFGSSLAALAPSALGSGAVVFQPFDAATFDALDVIAQAYSASGASLKPEGAPTTLLKLTKSNTPLAILRDDQERLWVEASGMSGSTFVVLARAP